MTATRWAVAAIVLAALAGGGAALATGRSAHHVPMAEPPRHPASPSPPKATARAPKPATGSPVHVHASLLESDGQTYGVGMPIVVRFSRSVTDPEPFERAATVRVDGRPAAGAWYWEKSSLPGYAVEAHYRLARYWPAHADIAVDLPVAGRSAGPGLVYDDNLTLSIATGAAHVSTVDAATKRMTVTSDGRVVRTLGVSLGKASTPTYQGTKVLMEFDRIENMNGTPVPWSVRLTDSGEFVHAAPWNSRIGQANLSHGCTNLSPADAEWFYRFSLLGDVVVYPDAPGPTARVWDGLGDWNVSWATWSAGGLRAGAKN